VSADGAGGPPDPVPGVGVIGRASEALLAGL
jgi:hypothetical protein